MFSLFTSLEVLSFHFSFGQLHFGQAHQPEARTPVDAAEAGMLWYTSRIVQHIPSLQVLYINEGHDDENHNSGHHWSVKGWLNVVSKPGGTREVVGTLRKL